MSGGTLRHRRETATRTSLWRVLRERMASRSAIVSRVGLMGASEPACRCTPEMGPPYSGTGGDSAYKLGGCSTTAMTVKESWPKRRRPWLFVVEACVVPIYAILVVPPSLIGVAAVLAVIRAKKDDLPDIVRALMRMGPRDDDSGKGPPSLPKT
jgi:hypothetical protein